MPHNYRTGRSMTDLTDKQKSEYFRRSYTAVDGLWFMKLEEKHGLEEALQLDEAVWKVLPKIQARTIKAMMNLGYGLDSLQAAIAARLDLEGFEFELKRQENSFLVIIHRCPWQGLMIKSRRENISERVSDLICRVENSVWASEFANDGAEKIRFEQEDRICQGAKRCRLKFCR
jgi:hypothetical protein